MQLNASTSTPPPPHKTTEAFGSLSSWLSTPQHAFHTWISREAEPFRPFAAKNTKPYAASTITVYVAMFNNFCTWLEHRGLSFHQAQPGTIQAFIDTEVTGRGQKKHHRRAYVHLLERAFTRLIQLGWGGANPARIAALRGAGAGKNDATQFLSKAERRQMIRHLAIWQDEASKEEEEESSWIGRRDKAMAAAILGGGVKVSELRRMTFNCIVGDGESLRIGHGPSARTVFLLPFARPILAKWLALHEDLKLPPANLFPATPRGARRRPGAKPNAPVHQATIHRRINLVLASAGIQLGAGQGKADAEPARLCAQTLRNTYGAQLLDDGRDDEFVAVAMGITKFTAERLRRAYTGGQRARRNQNP